MFKVLSYESPAEAQHSAGQILGEELFRAKDIPALLLLSGGSAFKVLDSVPQNVLPEDLTIGMLDERYSSDPTINNFAQFAASSFYEVLKNREVSFLDSRVDPSRESLEAYVFRLETGLKEWRQKNLQGKVIITQGIGTDGHTAGIMPFPENPALFKELFLGSRWVAGYDAGPKNAYPIRATITIPFLKTEVDFSLVFATGPEKKPLVKRLFEEAGNLEDMPARVVREMRSVVLVTS